MSQPPPPDMPVPRPGAPRAGAVPRMETVRLTAPDLARRAALERSRGRIVFAAGFFALLFTLVSGKLALATFLDPLLPTANELGPLVPPEPPSQANGSPQVADAVPHAHRASITDRNGQILAVSLPVASVFADPRQLMDPAAEAAKLKRVLPDIDVATITRRLGSDKDFVYIDRNVTPSQEIAINDLGIPGIYFQPSERRIYPLGRVAAQVLGGVDVDQNGIAGVERFFNKRLETDAAPLRLSLDVRVQAVLRDVLDAAQVEFKPVGSAGIVMDVNTGEILAMVSLPDYDANDFGNAPADARFNRAVTGMYEPGSTFKLQTVALGLQEGILHIWDRFRIEPIPVGRFSIHEMATDHFPASMALPQVIAYSSNIGASHMALDEGAERQQAWLRAMGFFRPAPVQLPESAWPIVPPLKNWGVTTLMTVSFGQGIAESPLAITRGTAAVNNGGVLITPTLLAQPPSTTPVGPRLLSTATSEIVRKLMRLVVTQGIGKAANVPGYFVGGKTGTAERVNPHGGYYQHSNVAAFTSVFPMNAPRYAVYVMLDAPVGNKSTYGFTTGGMVAAPLVAQVISRIGPMLGLYPQTADAAQIDASLAMPLQPSPPPGARVLTATNDPGDPGGESVLRAPWRTGIAVSPGPEASRHIGLQDQADDATATVASR